MSVYVDQIQEWPTRIACFKAGSCHLVADSIEELHGFAKLLGLRRGWFQDKSLAHYDLTVGKRAAALRMGAKEASREEMGARIKAARLLHA